MHRSRGLKKKKPLMLAGEGHTHTHTAQYLNIFPHKQGCAEEWVCAHVGNGGLSFSCGCVLL